MIKATAKDAYQLFHQGAITLAQIEANGIRIDLDYLKKTKEEVKAKIQTLETKLREDKIFRVWKKKIDKPNLGSREQLGRVLFDLMGFESTAKTDTGRHKVDESVLANLDCPFAKDYLQWEKLKKVLSTNLNGIEDETVDGYLHPFFNLAGGGEDDDQKGGARSYRSSSSAINFQNTHARNPELSAIVRKCFVPRKGRQIIEVDFGGIEVRISACYNLDPVLIGYIQDPTKDMHRDMAAQCFMLDVKEVNKKARYVAKNKFVFPQFYGSYYLDCARGMWEEMLRMSLTVGESPVPIIDHLKEKGIKSLGDCNSGKPPKPGTFERHIKEVEKDFWENRFRVYNQWKKKWWNSYLKKGKFSMLTGFEVSGIYRKNEVLNFAVQGSAFHCLLWSLTQIQKWLRKNRMKTLLVGQIHDSIVADVVPSELSDFLGKAKEVMTVDLPKHWQWIIVNLEVEAEATPIDGSWFEKKAVA